MEEKIGRRHVLPNLTIYLLRQLPGQPTKNMDYIDEADLVNFLHKIQTGYRASSEVPYHNDMHGADCMQFAFYALTKSNMIEKAKLESLDVIAMIIAAACHDYDHDGFNNGYHVNSMSQRATRYHNQSV